jgi:hypothetical protein
MKFYRIAYQTINSGLVIRWCQITKWGNGFEISVSRDGVMLHGSTPHLNAEDIQNISTIMQRAESFVESMETLRASNVAAIPISSEPACVIETRRAHFLNEDEILETRQEESVQS